MTTTRQRPSWTLKILSVALLLTRTVAEDNAVTCGSVVKFQQSDTNYYLNSETKSLNTGSGQQLVTFVQDPATHNTLWRIRPANHDFEGLEYPPTTDDTSSACQLAQPIPCGSMIRLTHLNTNRNLHSHGVESVLSKQQEVTAYGEGDGEGDGGDNWKVTCEGKFWLVDQPFRLWHVDTQKYLGTAKTLEFNRDTCGSQCPIMNHLEAFCRKSADTYSLLKVTQGVHLSK